MTVAHKVSAAREPIGIIERRQQLRLRDFREDFNTFEYWFNTYLFLDRIYIDELNNR